MNYEVIGWPEIQEYMECDGFEHNTTLIMPNSDMGIEGSTYLVSKEWLESLKEE